MHTKSDNEEIVTGSDTDEIIEELFESFLQRYEQNLEEKNGKVQILNLMVLIFCIMIFIK